MLEKMIKWMTDRRGVVYYSMSYRNGQRINAAGVLSSSGRPGYDCSSAVYYSLVDAGFLPPTAWIGNTDSLYGDLERNGWTRLPLDASGNAKTQRGDIFLWGKRGASGGSFGHTGVFVDADNIIHCNYGNNGITINNHDAFWVAAGQPSYTFYRYVGKPAPSTGINRGDTVVFPNSYIVEQRATVNGITQVAAKALYVRNFDWTDNGVAVAGINKVDDDGYHLEGIAGVGDRFVIPGLFTVKDVVADGGTNYALVTVGGYEVWIATSALTKSITGKARPVARPKPVEPAPVEPEAPAPKTPETPPEPVEEEPKTDPEPQPEAPQEPDKPVKEDNNMAFSQEQAQEILTQTKSIQELANDVAGSEAVKEITDGISKKTKVIVYLIGDTLIGLGLVLPSIIVGFNLKMEVFQVVSLSTGLATAGAFILTMFGIYKNGK